MRVPLATPPSIAFDLPLNFLTGGKAGQAGVSDHFFFSCLRLIQSRTTKTKSTINPMAATTSRPPLSKQNGSTNPSMNIRNIPELYFANLSILFVLAPVSSSNNHRKKRMPIYPKSEIAIDRPPLPGFVIPGNAERLYALLPDFVGDISLSHNPNSFLASINALVGPIDKSDKHQARRPKGLTGG